MLLFPNIFSYLTCNFLPVVATVPRGDICAGASGMGAASSLQGPITSAPATASGDQHAGPGGIVPGSPWAAPRVLAAAQCVFLFIVTTHCSVKLHLETWVLRYKYEEFQEGNRSALN